MSMPPKQPRHCSRLPASLARRRVFLSYLAVGLVALALRVANLGRFVTHDEIEFWFGRSESLLRAVQTGNFAAMEISTHPGVTTMWLGAAGTFLRRLLFEHHLLTSENFPLILALHRLPVALAHVVALLAGYALLRRLLPATVALLAALLWATDPFIIGYSRLLHVDALVGSFATLSLLAACLAWLPGKHHHPAPLRWHWLLLSGVCGALAALSKSPGLAVVPIVGLLALREWRTGRIIGSLPVWGIAFAITVPIVWPAVWVAPGHVYEALRVGVEVEGGSPHMTGNFFLGQRTPAPGPLYYPVALALRTTPWALAGLLLLPVAAWPRRATRSPHTLRTLAVLAGFIVLFVVALSFFPKKFNRYIVPTFPALTILAAVGLVWGIEQITRLAWHNERGRARGQRTLVGIVALAALFNAAWFHPYNMAYFNQAFGGAQAGARTFAIGWGEGFEQVATWLNQQPDSPHVLTISHMITSLNPYLKAGARATFPDAGRLKEGAGYVVVYVYQVQGGPPPPPFDRFYGHVPPLHTVTIHGIEYAQVYDAPPPVTRQAAAEFGAHLWLYGFEGGLQAQPGETLRLKLVWLAHTPPPHDYWLFAHLIGSNGQRRAQVDQPYPTRQWKPGRFVPTELAMDLPADTPPGSYRLVLGLYDPASSQRLPLQTTASLAPALAGPHALLLARIEVGTPPPPATPE